METTHLNLQTAPALRYNYCKMNAVKAQRWMHHLLNHYFHSALRLQDQNTGRASLMKPLQRTERKSSSSVLSMQFKYIL